MLKDRPVTNRCSAYNAVCMSKTQAKGCKSKAAKKGVVLYVTKCKFCGYYHVSNNEPERVREINRRLASREEQHGSADVQ